MYRFSLRALLVLVTILCIFFSWYRTLPTIQQKHDVLIFNFPVGIKRFAYSPLGQVEFYKPMHPRPDGDFIWHYEVRFRTPRNSHVEIIVEDSSGKNYYYEYDGKTVNPIKKPKWFEWSMFDDARSQ